MREPVKGILTTKGRVVYDRKRHFLTWGAIWRFVQAIERPQSSKEREYYVQTALRMFMIFSDMLNVLINSSNPFIQRYIMTVESLVERIYEEIASFHSRTADQRAVADLLDINLGISEGSNHIGNERSSQEGNYGG